MKVVIAGFGPFPGVPSNPSGLLAMALARRRRPALAGIDITSHVFATAYDAVDRDLSKLLARKPDVLLIFGLAGGRQHVCIETRARNARSILLPDVSGWRPEHRTLEGDQEALTGSAPFPHLLSAIRKSGLPARLSRDAGAYLCNYAYWLALQGVRGGRPLVQFVHIPWVGATSRRGTRKRSALQFCRLISAGENLLIALIAASRQSNSLPNEALPLPGFGQPQTRSNCVKAARSSAPSPRARSR